MKTLSLTLAIICLFQLAGAQQTLRADSLNLRPNLLKLNVTSIFVKNYSLQYERIVNKHVSLALSARFMPDSKMPFRNTIKNMVLEEDNQFVTDVVNLFTFSNVAITPEVRFYVGKKGYGRGFYIAPYYRFASYKMSKKTINYEVSDTENYDVSVEGHLTSNTAGLLLGAQWNLTKNIILDWWIAGPNIGFGNGAITGVINTAMTDDAQKELKKNLEEVDIPLVKEKVYVDANHAKMQLGGGWGGIRAGILLGLTF